MAQTPYDTGGGGLAGTAGSICAISPDDLVGTVGNLISRLEAAETAISSILGADLFTERLSNLSEQVGWVYGVEYMGVPGWIQTEYGTLIPPPGFTLSGNGFTLPNACTGEDTPYQGVVMDENGVLQFGFTPAGELCGAAVEGWNDGTINYYALVRTDGGGPLVSQSRGVTINSHTGVGASFFTSFTIEHDGLYELKCGGEAHNTDLGASLVSHRARAAISLQATGDEFAAQEGGWVLSKSLTRWDTGAAIVVPDGPSSASCGALVNLAEGDVILMTFGYGATSDDTSASQTIGHAYTSIMYRGIAEE